MKAASLVIFTVLLQAAAGLCAGMAVLALLVARRMGAPAAGLVLDNGVAALLLLVIVGMLASLFHLGSPLRAYRAVSNLRSSWLAREILLSVLFAAASLALAGLQAGRIGPPEARLGMACAAALLGLGLVGCMAQVYRLRTVPAWNAWLTPVSFYATAFFLGSLALQMIVGTGALAEAAAPWIGGSALFFLGVLLWLAPSWVTHLGSRSVTRPTLAGRGGLAGGEAQRVRLALLLLCGVTLILILPGGLPPAIPGLGAPWPAWLAFCIGLTAEIIGRALFYQARNRGEAEGDSLRLERNV